jgi:hypothetical protein
MSQSAAFMVLDSYPSEDEIDELVYAHLDEIDSDEVEASIDILDKAPDWLSICEQDQINAHLRDGGVCVLVLYITVGESADDDD